MKLYELHLRSGAGDFACADCLAEARRELAEDLVSVAEVAAAVGNYCMWCGWPADLRILGEES